MQKNMLVFQRNYQIIYISSTTQNEVSYCNHLIKSCWEEEQISSTGQNRAALCFLRASRMLMRISTGDTGAWRWNIPQPENRGSKQLMCPLDQADEHTGGKTRAYDPWATELHDELPTFLKNCKGGQQNPHFFTLNLLLTARFRLETALSGAQETQFRKIREWTHRKLSNGS